MTASDLLKAAGVDRPDAPAYARASAIVDSPQQAAEYCAAATDLGIALEALLHRVLIEGQEQAEDSAASILAFEQRAGRTVSARLKDQAVRSAAASFRGSVGLATRTSPATVVRRIHDARSMQTKVPSVFAALCEGNLSHRVARGLTREAERVVDPVNLPELDQVLARELPRRSGESEHRLRALARTIVDELEPDAAAEREWRARERRHVRITSLPDGMSAVRAEIPAIDAERVNAILDAASNEKLSNQPGAVRTKAREHARADALVELLLGGDSPRSTVSIGVIVTDRALLSPRDSSPATIEGYGNVQAKTLLNQLAREHLDTDTQLFYHRLYTNPTSGELIAADSRQRAFPTAMARFLRARDVRCRGPYCGARIAHSDHSIPAAEGGPTSIDNGQSLCVLCNCYKETYARAIPIARDAAGFETATAWVSKFPGIHSKPILTAPHTYGDYRGRTLTSSKLASGLAAMTSRIT